MRYRMYFCLAAALFLCVALSAPAFAAGERSHDRTQVGSNISIGPQEEVGELTCFGCSIHVRGHVEGDVTTFGGSITLEDQAQITGDATAFAGDIRLERTVKVDGDVTVFGGRIARDSEARVGGDVTAMGGRGWITLIVLTPFVLLGLFIALVVWLVQRLTRRPTAVAAM